MSKSKINTREIAKVEREGITMSEFKDAFRQIMLHPAKPKMTRKQQKELTQKTAIRKSPPPKQPQLKREVIEARAQAIAKAVLKSRSEPGRKLA